MYSYSTLYNVQPSYSEQLLDYFSCIPLNKYLLLIGIVSQDE